MSRPLDPLNPNGVVTDDLPEDTSQPITETQYPNKPCDPRAIHDRYPPISLPPVKLPVVS